MAIKTNVEGVKAKQKEGYFTMERNLQDKMSEQMKKDIAKKKELEKKYEVKGLNGSRF